MDEFNTFVDDPVDGRPTFEQYYAVELAVAKVRSAHMASLASVEDEDLPTGECLGCGRATPTVIPVDECEACGS